MNDDTRARPSERRAPTNQQRTRDQDRRPPAQEQRRPPQERAEQDAPPAQEAKVGDSLTIPGLKTFVPVREVSWVKMLLYGKPGVGKTWAATLAPPPVLFLSTQGQSTGTVAAAMDAGAPKTPMVSIQTWRELDDAITALQNAARRGPLPYQTIVADLLGEWRELALREVLGLAPGVVPRRPPDMGQWATINAIVRTAATKLRELPAHIVFLTHATDKTDEKTKRRQLEPGLTETMTDFICGSCSVYGYAFVSQTGSYGQERLVRSVCFETPSSTMDMIARRGGLIEPYEPLDIARIIRRFNGIADQPGESALKAPMLTSDVTETTPTTPTNESEAR